MPTTTEIFENALKNLAKKEEKAFPVSVDLPRSYPAVSNTMSPLALGSTAAIGATAAFPDEGESASIPWKKANRYLEDTLGAQYKRVTREEKDNLRRWVSTDIPDRFGVKTPATDAADLQFLEKGLANENRFKFPSQIMNDIRLGQAATPEEVISRMNLDVHFLDPSNLSKGNFGPTGNTGFRVGYNPLHPNFDGTVTPGHEVAGHGPQLIKLKQGSFDSSLDNKLDFVNSAGLSSKKELSTLPYSPADRNTSVYENASPEQKEIIERAWDLYENNPMEVVARDMGDLFKKKLRQGDIASLRDYEKFKEAYGGIAGNAYTKYANENPATSVEIINKLKGNSNLGPNQPVVNSYALQKSQLKPSRTTAEMSNIDKTAKIGSYVNPDLNIPSGDIGGDFSAGASGAINAIKGVVGGAGGIAHRTMKSLGKVIDIATGQTNARSKPLDGDDYERVINAATAFFAPEKVALNTAVNAGFDWVDPSEVGAGSDLTSEMLSGKQEFRTTPYEQRTVPEAVQNIALGAGAVGLGALASKSKLLKNEAGAIQLEGFFSPLSRALKDRVVGKSVLSDKMTGEQVLKTLQSAGIKEDELVFSGVGDALMAIGKNRIGASKMEEISKIAEDGALGFKRNDSPGVYSSYSLFREGDPSFKNAVYTYPGVEFEEGHFGKGVVAHRRFGDKELFDTPLQRETEASGTGLNLNAALANDERFKNRKSTLLLDEVQSQFHEKGSRFGYGGMKGLPEGVDLANSSQNYKNFHAAYKDAALGDYSKVPENMKIDMDRYVKVGDIAENADRSTPQGFAAALSADDEASRIYSRYVPEADQSVENAPLRGEKYVELLAKDHLRDALASGKDSISWTPSDVQHKRYYGKDALGNIGWKFDTPETDKDRILKEILGANSIRQDYFKSFDDMKQFADGGWKNQLTGDELDDMETKDLADSIKKSLSREYAQYQPKIQLRVGNKDINITQIEELNKNIGATATKKLLEDMQNGLTSGTLEGGSKEVYQKLYDRAIPKAFEKLTGEKPRKGFVKDRNGDEVEIMWIPLDKTKEKMVKDAPYKLTPEAIRDVGETLDSYPVANKVISDIPGLQDAERILLRDKKKVEKRIQENSHPKQSARHLKDISKDLEAIREFKEKHLPKVKDLPIAHSQEVLDFFEPSEKQQAMA